MLLSLDHRATDWRPVSGAVAAGCHPGVPGVRRRWVVGVVVAVLAAIAGPIPTGPAPAAGAEAPPAVGPSRAWQRPGSSAGPPADDHTAPLSWRPGPAAAGAASGSSPRRIDRPTVFASGTATYHGSTRLMRLNAPLGDIVPTEDGDGYWLLADDGGVFAYGRAPFWGSTGDMVLNAPAQAMAAGPGDRGYWFAASDGGVFTFGRLDFHGSMGGRHLNAPVVGIRPTPTAEGYWLVASDGGVFAFGDARFTGSLGGDPPPDPVVSLAPTPDGRGYWLLDASGRIWPFGSASRPSGRARCAEDATDLAADPAGAWLYVLCAEGAVEVLDSGAAPAGGDVVVPPAPEPDVELGPGMRATAIAVSPDGGGVWVTTSGVAPRSAELPPPGGPHAFIHVGHDGRPLRWSPCAPLTWRYSPAGAPAGVTTAEAVAFIDEGFAYLAELTGLTFRYGGTIARTDPLPAHQVAVGWSVMARGNLGRAGVVPDATPWGTRLVYGAVELNSAESLPLTWGAEGWGPVLLHELGHVLNLDHVDDPAQLMYFASLGQRDVAPGDLEGLIAVSALWGC